MTEQTDGDDAASTSSPAPAAVAPAARRGLSRTAGILVGVAVIVVVAALAGLGGYAIGRGDNHASSNACHTYEIRGRQLEASAAKTLAAVLKGTLSTDGADISAADRAVQQAALTENLTGDVYDKLLALSSALSSAHVIAARSASGIDDVLGSPDDLTALKKAAAAVDDACGISVSAG